MTTSAPGQAPAPAQHKYVPDALWARLSPLVDVYAPPTSRRCGRRPTDPRRIYEALLYRQKTGCPWHLLPGWYPDSSTVHRWYVRWNESGLLDQMNATTLHYYLQRGWYRPRRR